MDNNFRIIIDGYNLIFQCGLEGRSRNPIALERARDRLLTTLAANLSPDQIAKTVIVFDAESLPIKESASHSAKLGITVIFAVDFEDADTLIELLILKNSTPKRLTVVSSDHRLHKSALRRKSTPIDSDIWFDRLTEAGQSDSPTDRSGGSDVGEPGKPDLEQLKQVDWASEFGLNDSATQEKPEIGTVPDVTYNPFPPGYADDISDEGS